MRPLKLAVGRGRLLGSLYFAAVGPGTCSALRTAPMIGKIEVIYSNCQTSAKSTITSYAPHYVGWYIWETNA